MGAPYSLDLRQRAVGAVADGMSCAEAEELSGEPLLGDPLDEARSGDGEPGGAADGWQEAICPGRGIVTLTSDGRTGGLDCRDARIKPRFGRTSPDARHQKHRF